jgi:hypothetical protein
MVLNCRCIDVLWVQERGIDGMEKFLLHFQD